MKIIIVLAIVFATFFILKFLQLIIKRLGRKNNVLWTVNKMLPLIVSITWLVIIFWSAHYLFDEKSYYNYVVLCMIAILSILTGWFFIKDFIAGIIFRVQNNFAEGDYVQFGDVAGKVEALFLTHISINTKEGKVLRVPYSRLSNEIISQKTSTKTFEENSYTLNTGKKESIKSTEDAIRSVLITSPWRISNKQPDVKFVSEDEKYYNYKIQVQVRNQKHFNYLMEVLEKKFRN